MINTTGNNYAYVGLNLPISSANINGTGLMLNERVKYTAKTGIAIIQTANPIFRWYRYDSGLNYH